MPRRQCLAFVSLPRKIWTTDIESEPILADKLAQLEQQGYGNDAAYNLKMAVRKSGKGLKLAGQGLSLAGSGKRRQRGEGRRIERVKRYMKTGVKRLAPHLGQAAKYLGRELVAALKEKWNARGGFIFTTAALIAAGIAAAQAAALGGP
jgi:hypothetical protein